jgi:hypothetical protein
MGRTLLALDRRARRGKIDDLVGSAGVAYLTPAPMMRCVSAWLLRAATAGIDFRLATPLRTDAELRTQPGSPLYGGHHSGERWPSTTTRTARFFRSTGYRC